MKDLYFRKIIMTGLILAVLVSIGIVISAEMPQKAVSDAQNTALSSEIKSESLFYIKEHGDIIGVFDADGELLYTVEIYIKTLPATDRELLRKGIAARDGEELYEILGDYDS